MERCSFGKTKDGREASLVTMKNENGMTVSVTDYGATLVSIRVPEGDKTTDVVLGYDSAADYGGVRIGVERAVGRKRCAGTDDWTEWNRDTGDL